MSDYCISVEHLTKRYRLGQSGASRDGLRHQLEQGVRSLFSSKSAVWSGQPAKPRGPEEFLALNDVSFQIKAGAVLGIVGRNGAGKSTLLKILSRITPPTSGQICVRGRIASLLEVGTGFHPDLTGRENIFLNGAILGMHRAEISRKFDEIVAFAEIEKFIDTPVKRYSSGMYVRLAFAVAAHLEPEILIVDEVLAVGDAQFQKKCIGKMNEVAQSHGRTVLFVSHQMSAVRKLCNIGLLLTSGTTTGLAPVEETVQNYLGKLVASERVLDLSKTKRDAHALNTALMETLSVDDDCSLCYGEPLILHLDFTCTSTIIGAYIGIGIDSAEGHRVLSLDSDVRAKALDFAPGKYRATFTLPDNPLSPGLYNIGCAMYSGGALVDTCAAGTWEILPGQNDVISNRSGACRPAFVTNVKKL